MSPGEAFVRDIARPEVGGEAEGGAREDGGEGGAAGGIEKSEGIREDGRDEEIEGG